MREDADPNHRVAVRLIQVEALTDPSSSLFASAPPPSDAVTRVRWDEEDALRFPLCISVAERPGIRMAEAWGDIVLADHGRTISDERLGTVAEPTLYLAATDDCVDCDASADPIPIPVRFRPILARSPLTHGGPDRRPSSPRSPSPPVRRCWQPSLR